MKKYYLVFFIAIISLYSCKKNNADFEVSDFAPINNFQTNLDSLKTIELDYTDAIDSGFIIPTVRQVSEGVFKFEFSIKNNSKEPQIYYYKIYYQNETYKFSEQNCGDDKQLMSENFYGSWENTDIGFIKTEIIPNDNEFHKIKGEYRIVGNPRNEKLYYGDKSRFSSSLKPSDSRIKEKINEISNNPDWYKSIQEKAKTNNVSVERQLELDAIFILESQPQSGGEYNNRWKRNPRVGLYSMMLAVTTTENIKNNIIPNYIQNINLQNNSVFVNPYVSLTEISSNQNNIVLCKKSNVLKVVAHPDLGKGIYINISAFKNKNFDTTYFNSNCGYNYRMYKNAVFAQYMHSLKDDVLLNNIPVTADIFSEKYSIKDYADNVKEYYNKRVTMPVQVTKCPCETVNSDSISHSITVRNPASKPGENKKESVGVITRHGFTYGKYRAKVKLTRLLNDKYVWNGITDAIWLIYESNDDWNKRRICVGDGFQPTYYSGKKDKRVPAISYSEIDFEILKASHRWPATSYSNVNDRPKDDPTMKDKIMVTCTNWDMACWEPKNFGVGVNSLDYDNQTFYLHRWDHWYNAVTLKNPQPEAELFNSDFYYFEIDWLPTEIIWKIGPSKDKMRVVGYMNNTVTSIPNNQMLMIFTQEFHITKWWPEAPFAQDNIPFPAKDYVGHIYELEIE